MAQPHERPKATPLCPGCLAPVQLAANYCPRCGWDTGQLTPYLPFVNISWQANGLGRLWRRIWWDPRRRWYTRLGDLVLLLLMAPVMLIGLPFVWRTKRSSRSGPAP